MTKAAILILLLFVLLARHTHAQSQAPIGGPCPTGASPSQLVSTRSPDLICLIPQIYGSGGLVSDKYHGPLVNTSALNPPFGLSFQNGTFTVLGALSRITAAIGTHLSQLPIASPASGVIFSFNPSLGVDSLITQTFGPILSERATTIGRHKLFIGVSYQYFDFDEVDGVKLRSFGAVFTQSGLPPTSCTGCAPTSQDDFITTHNRMDLTIHEGTVVAGFGVTGRMDVSVAVPILDVRMSMFSTATIHSFETYPASVNSDSCYADPVLMSAGVKGCMNQFSLVTVPGEMLLPAQPYPFGQSQAAFSSASSKFGIGDLIFRGKFQAIKGEKAGLAFGIDVHAPTGNELDFLGSGTWGIRPFAVFSYSARFAPHASFGYQFNGKSILGGDVTVNQKSNLPHVFTYDAGLDAGVSRWLSLSVDFLGQTQFDTQEIAQGTVADFVGNSYTTIGPGADQTTNSEFSMAVGGKIKAFRRLLLTANVLFRVNEAGLHSKPSPLIGASYTL